VDHFSFRIKSSFKLWFKTLTQNLKFADLKLCIVMLFGAMGGQLWWALAFLATHHCI